MTQAIFGQGLHRHPEHRIKSVTKEQGKKEHGVIPCLCCVRVQYGGFINCRAQ